MINPNLIHGYWDIQLLESKNIVLIKRAEAWNKEAALQYAEEFNQAIEPLIGRKWCSIGYAVDYGLGVPEIEQIIKDMYQALVKKGCISQTTIIESALGAQHLGKMASVPSKDFQLKFVQSPQQAVDFVKTLGFELPMQELTNFIERPYPERF